MDALSGGRLTLSAVALCCAALLAGLALASDGASGKKKGGGPAATVTSGDQNAILSSGAVPVQAKKGNGKVLVRATGNGAPLGDLTAPRKLGKGGALQLPLTDAGKKLVGGCSADHLEAVVSSKKGKKGKKGKKKARKHTSVSSTP